MLTESPQKALIAKNDHWIYLELGHFTCYTQLHVDESNSAGIAT